MYANFITISLADSQKSLKSSKLAPKTKTFESPNEDKTNVDTSSRSNNLQTMLDSLQLRLKDVEDQKAEQLRELNLKAEELKESVEKISTTNRAMASELVLTRKQNETLKTQNFLKNYQYMRVYEEKKKLLMINGLSDFDRCQMACKPYQLEYNGTVFLH